MKPPPFKYYDPTAQNEVVGLLSSLENLKLLAGGQSLLPMLNMRFVLPDHVVDLNRVAGLDFVEADAGGGLRIGAMTRQRTLEFSADVAARAPLIREAVLHVGHRQTRNRGTLGGSLSHLDPAAELVTAAVALDAVVALRGPAGLRQLAMSEFMLGYMTPATNPDEMLVSVTFPALPAAHGWGFVEFARRHGDFAIASAAATLVTDAQGRISKVALALGGIGVVPLRMPELETGLLGAVASEALFADHCRACATVEAMDDALVTAGYRQQLAPVMARRALMAALQRSGGGAATQPH